MAYLREKAKRNDNIVLIDNDHATHVTPHTSRNCLTFPVLVRLKSSPPTKEN
jgi:hypothetical protein